MYYLQHIKPKVVSNIFYSKEDSGKQHFAIFAELLVVSKASGHWITAFSTVGEM
jgi:hypothetical protein